MKYFSQNTLKYFPPIFDRRIYLINLIKIIILNRISILTICHRWVERRQKISLNILAQ